MYFGNYGTMLHNFDIFNPAHDLLAIPLLLVRLIKFINMESASLFSTKCNCPILSLIQFLSVVGSAGGRMNRKLR